MDEYRKKLDSIRAPEALIAATLDRIHKEEDGETSAPAQKPTVIEPFKPRRRRLGYYTAAAAAAVLALVIGLNMSSPRPELTYGTIADTVVRAAFPADKAQSIDIQEYSSLVGMDVEALISGADLVKADIWIDTENELIVSDECTLVYNSDGKPLTLRLSAKLDVIPEELSSLPPTELEGLAVHAAVSESGSFRMAGFRAEGLSFYLSGSNMQQQQFEELLNELIKNIQK